MGNFLKTGTRALKSHRSRVRLTHFNLLLLSNAGRKKTYAYSYSLKKQKLVYISSLTLMQGTPNFQNFPTEHVPVPPRFFVHGRKFYLNKNLTPERFLMSLEGPLSPLARRIIWSFVTRFVPADFVVVLS